MGGVLLFVLSERTAMRCERSCGGPGAPAAQTLAAVACAEAAPAAVGAAHAPVNRRLHRHIAIMVMWSVIAC